MDISAETERRDPLDRRRRPTQPWDVLFFPARRSGFRRDNDIEASRCRIVDRHGWFVWLQVLSLLVLTLLDGVLTVELIGRHCEEANPFMLYLLQRHGVLGFFATKYVLTVLGLMVLLALRNYQLFRSRFHVGYLISVLLVLYVTLLSYQVVLLRTELISQREAFSEPAPLSLPSPRLVR